MKASRILTIWLAFALPAALSAQAKRALTQADWDHWKSINGAALSNDGKWAVYSLVPQVGDGDMVVRATQGTTEYRVPRGYLGRPNNVPGGLRPAANANPEGEPGGPNIAPAQFTADSKFAIALTYPTQAEFDRAPRARRGGGGAGGGGGAAASSVQNRSDLAILSLADGQVTAVQRVRSFRLPRDNGKWLAYQLEDDSANVGGGGRGAQGAGGRRQYGTTLVVKDLSTGSEERIPDVLAFAFDDSAKVLAYTVSSRTPEKDGAYARNLATGATIALLTGNGNYKELAVDRSATQVAFVSDRDDAGKEKPAYSLYYASLKNGAAQSVVVSTNLADGMRVADNGTVSFTHNGSAIVFGVAEPAVDSVPPDSLVGKAVFDLWNYKDKTLQPQQKLTAARDRTRFFESVYWIANKKVVQLANDSIPSVSISDDGRLAVASSKERYAIESMWGDGGNDVYVIDAATGVKRLIKEEISGNAQLSPEGRYAVYFDKGHWYTYNTSTGRTVDVSSPIKGVSFEQETHDTPSIPPAWGLAGWTKGEKALLLYDRWDIWEVDPNGNKAAVMVTDSVGRRDHLVFRLAESVGRGRGAGGRRGGGPGGGGDAESREIDPAEPLLLRATDDETKAAGFYRDKLGEVRPPEKIVMADASWGEPIKAANAEQYLVTKGSFVDFPNLYTGASLTQLNRISDANPQQKDFNWGTVELVHWMSADGVPLKGLLYKPENFDPSKKYPMIAYFYEQLSNTKNNYIAPTGRNVINPTHYVSNGYLVFEPDIHYEVGYPGPSAVKSIVPGVEMLLARGYVDPKGLGLQGQSWGGYQTAFLITQTHMFNAAMAGAPVVNMTSAYGGIRWGSGLARAFQYEHTQSRIGGSIWQYPMRYFENSPLFWLDKVTTPLFIMSDDADDAVPWYQGIEFFVAMRRLGKEVYLVNYNNDVHNPASRANQKDVAMRMQQFFDNKLRGYPAPDWMTHGIPYLAKGKDQLNKPPVATQAGGTGAVPER